eukprot:2399809-Prymnesium_polylepis.1
MPPARLLPRGLSRRRPRWLCAQQRSSRRCRIRARAPTATPGGRDAGALSPSSRVPRRTSGRRLWLTRPRCITRRAVAACAPRGRRRWPTRRCWRSCAPSALWRTAARVRQAPS